MPYYFAFGSNMHRARLERRVGAVVDHGWAVLENYRHGFTKRAADVGAAGNIEPRPGCEVHGVLYELTAPQLEVLAGYEPGYERVALEILAGGDYVEAASFRAFMWVSGLVPTEAYIEHYRRGMVEHGLPDDYVREVLAEAAAARARA